MSALGDAPSSSPSRFPEGSIEYYKSQYEQLEAELADFQASSKELEAELEKDVEAAERRESQLKEKVESLGYEAEEWKTKYKQSKEESNKAQNTLQKEITTLRETNRAVQLKLRDIEVSNDDYERQARNTTSSLDDLESKYNQSIERGVMADEEIKNAEQEREALRIETQRLRDELNDLKIEAEIRAEKLRNAEAATERYRKRKPSPLASETARSQSALSHHSPTTSASSPTVATPPTKSESSNVSETPTPPSPPTSDKSIPTSATTTPSLQITKSRISINKADTTPRPSQLSSRMPRHSRGPSIPVTSDRTPSYARPTASSRPKTGARGPGLPSSGSLYHLHGLMSKMQLLEQRVQSARSKLPGPTSTPPGASPRSNSSLGQSYVPSTVTVRSNRKRTGGSNASSATPGPSDRPGSRLSSTYTPSADRPASRLSFGFQPSQQTSPLRESQVAPRPPSRDPKLTRPTSRASISSRHSISHRQSLSHLPGATTGAASSSRPSSRQSITGRSTPLGHHHSSSSQSDLPRPNSAVGGSYAASHSHTGSIRRLSNFAVAGAGFAHHDEEEAEEVLTPTPSRTTLLGAGKDAKGGRTSATAVGVGRRTSSGMGMGMGEMGPPKPPQGRKLSGVGETY